MRWFGLAALTAQLGRYVSKGDQGVSQLDFTRRSASHLPADQPDEIKGSASLISLDDLPVICQQISLRCQPQEIKGSASLI